MKERVPYDDVIADAARCISPFGAYVKASGLERSLTLLVMIRASQMNGCALCLDMHCREARATGETEERLDGVAAWRESPFFSDRERAAFEWTEAVTRLDQGHVSDAVYESARGAFSQAELMALTMSILSINSWNRVSVAFRWDPRSQRRAEAKRRE